MKTTFTKALGKALAAGGFKLNRKKSHNLAT